MEKILAFEDFVVDYPLSIRLSIMQPTGDAQQQMHFLSVANIKRMNRVRNAKDFQGILLENNLFCATSTNMSIAHYTPWQQLWQIK